MFLMQSFVSPIATTASWRACLPILLVMWDIWLFDQTVDTGVFWRGAFVSADLFDNRSPLYDGAEDVAACFPLGDGVKLAPIFLHDEHDGDSVGGAEG
jgi:hypothetical protein